MPRLKVMSEFRRNRETEALRVLKQFIRSFFCSGLNEDATPRSFFHVRAVERINWLG